MVGAGLSRNNWGYVSSASHGEDALYESISQDFKSYLFLGTFFVILVRRFKGAQVIVGYEVKLSVLTIE
jgi:hypothetical protein